MDRFFWTNADADLLPSWYDIPRGPKDAAGWREMKTKLLAETQRVVTREMVRGATPAALGKVQAAVRCSLTPCDAADGGGCAKDD